MAIKSKNITLLTQMASKHEFIEDQISDSISLRLFFCATNICIYESHEISVMRKNHKLSLTGSHIERVLPRAS